MARKDKHAVDAASIDVLEQQKQVLVNAFSELAHSMRRAADEAQRMATVVANTDPYGASSDSTKAVFHQRNNAELSKIIQQNAPGGMSGQMYMAAPLHTPISPASDQPTPGSAQGHYEAAPSKKRPRASTGPTPAPSGQMPASGVSLTAAGRPKKEKKIKDPLAPKRPASAYILYQNDVRRGMVERHPELSYREVLGEISKQWSELLPAEKLRYQQMVERGKVVYEQQKAQYDREHPGGGPIAPSPVHLADSVPPPTGIPHPSVAALPAHGLPASITTATPSSGSSLESDSEVEEAASDSAESESDSDTEAPNGHGHPPLKKLKTQPAPPPIASVKAHKKSPKKF